MYFCFKAKKIIAAALTVLVPLSCIVFFIAGRLLISTTAENDRELPVYLPVIMYHSVWGNSPAEYRVTPQQLENDLQWLSNNGYNSVSCRQLIDYTANRSQLPDKPVLITFDDGFYNNLSEALPLLNKYNMCAVVSVVGSYTDVNAADYPHHPDCSYLTWEDISQLIDSCRIEIGNHTYDMHSLNTGRNGCLKLYNETENEYRSSLSADLELLQLEMKENTGYTPFVFAYPYGAVSRESLPILRENGFLVTLPCRETGNFITRDPDCLLGLGRFNRSGLYSTEEFMESLQRKEL